MSNEVRISFGMIVLNGEPFIRYNLRSLYPYAHQIIVVEGACPGAKNIATKDGHSRDNTLETLRDFKANEDPEDKLIVVKAEDDGHKDGFWPGEKNEMSQAYAKRAAGNYLWQVDSDEFYTETSMKRIIDILAKGVDAVSLPMTTFWGGINYTVDGFLLRCLGAGEYHRVFRWGPGYTYKTHRPPTVLDECGKDTHDKIWLRAHDLEHNGIFLSHYSLLFPSQVQDKCDYYSEAHWAKRRDSVDWAQRSFSRLDRPFRVHNITDHVSWLTRFRGEHPKQIEVMMEDIVSGRIKKCVLRDNADIERLLNRWTYRVATSFLYWWALKRNTKCGRFLHRLWLAFYYRILRIQQRVSVSEHTKC